MLKRILILTFLMFLSSPALAGDIVQQFKSPSFNGYGWSSHVQSIEQQERSREQAIKDKAAAEEAKALAAASNTPLAKFMQLFTAQVYSQLATQLSNSLFAEGSTNNGGSFQLDGNTISYVKTGTDVTLTVVDLSGKITVISVPIASFAF